MPIAAAYQAQNIPPWLEAIAKSIAESSQNISREAYVPYAGRRVAPTNEYLKRAHEMASTTGLARPYFTRSSDLYNQSTRTFPQDYRAYENPYQEAVVNRIGELGARNFRENILPSLESTFVGMGQFGSSHHRQLAERAARDLQQETLARQQAALQQGYQQSAQMHASDQGRALEAARSMGDLGRYAQASHLTDIGALESAGERERGMAQANADMAYQDFLRQRAYPRAALAEHAGAVQGLPYSQHTYRQDQYPNVLSYPTSGPGAGGQPNLIGQLGNLGMNLYGMRQMGRKKGGHIPNPRPKMKSKIGKMGGNTMMTSSLVRHPKVGAKHSLPKRII